MCAGKSKEAEDYFSMQRNHKIFSKTSGVEYEKEEK